MDKRDQAIFDWVMEHKPDCIGAVKVAFGDDLHFYERFLLSVGFEGGRKFQIEHPEKTKPSKSDYLDKKTKTKKAIKEERERKKMAKEHWKIMEDASKEVAKWPARARNYKSPGYKRLREQTGL